MNLNVLHVKTFHHFTDSSYVSNIKHDNGHYALYTQMSVVMSHESNTLCMSAPFGTFADCVDVDPHEHEQH